MKKTRDIPKSQRRWVDVNLAGARFHNVNLSEAKIRGAILHNVDIDGWIPGLRVNGVEVAPLIEQELRRRHPERALIASRDPEDLREGWAFLEKAWKRTLTRARRLPERALFTRVDDEWSLAETLRHLVFVTDAWIGRTVLGEKDHYNPIGLGITDSPPWVSVSCGLDAKAKPTFDEILAARRSQMATVRAVLRDLTPAEWARRCRGNRSHGYPTDPKKYIVGQCINVVLNEEWEHHRFAVRDLEQLQEAARPTRRS